MQIIAGKDKGKVGEIEQVRLALLLISRGIQWIVPILSIAG